MDLDPWDCRKRAMITRPPQLYLKCASHRNNIIYINYILRMLIAICETYDLGAQPLLIKAFYYGILFPRFR